MKNRIIIDRVSTLSCLGDYASMLEHLLNSEPRDVMSVGPDSVCGRLPDGLLAGYAKSRYRHTRAELIILALIDQERPRLEQCIADVDPRRIAVVIGTSAGGISEAEATREHGHRFGDEYDFRFQRLGQVAKFTAERLGAEGLVTGVSTACTSGARAVGLGKQWLDLDWCDLAIVGGVDALCGVTSQGFAALEAVSPGFCRPFDRARDGINLGEGGALLVLRRTREAQQGEVVLAGYGESMDAWHMSAPHPEGRGISRAMNDALFMSGQTPADVGYVNMHGTGTQHNDGMEANAVLGVLGNRVPASSTKTMTGHTLGAAGAIEAVICYALARNDLQELPVQHGLQELDPDMSGLAVVTQPRPCPDPRVILSNSCGFGGHNASLVITH